MEEKKLDFAEIIREELQDMYEEFKDVEQGEHLYPFEAFVQDFSFEKLFERLKDNSIFKMAVLDELKNI